MMTVLIYIGTTLIVWWLEKLSTYQYGIYLD